MKSSRSATSCADLSPRPKQRCRGLRTTDQHAKPRHALSLLRACGKRPSSSAAENRPAPDQCARRQHVGDHLAALKMDKMQGGVFGAVSTSEALVAAF